MNRYKRLAIVSFSIAALFVIAIPVFAIDKNDLAGIQREGHYYYRIARLATVYNVKDAFKVLPKNSPASCSHEVAIKARLIKERLPDANFFVAVYNMHNNNYETRHTVIVVMDDDGYYIMNNRDRWLDRVDNLDWMYQAEFMTIDNAVKKYN